MKFLLVLLTSCVSLASGPGPARAAKSPPERLAPSYAVNPVLRDAPGYYPPQDPESLSVSVGRRLNAPAVKARFRGGARSLDELGLAICRMLHHDDRDSLVRLCVRNQEFAEILWPEFPQSRPATGLAAEDAWGLLENRNLGGIARALGEHRERPLAFVRWDRADTVARYRNFNLHQGLSLVVRNERGEEEALDVVRAVAERKGAYKLYSLKD